MPQKKSRRIVMKDIAERAGVHQTTVSLALRGHPSISVATRERIRKLADEMGYTPDPALSALVAYRSTTRAQPKAETLGYILNYPSPELFTESHVPRLLLDGARGRAEELGYHLEVFWYGRDYTRSAALDRVLKTRQIRGLILGAFDYRNLDLVLDWNSYSVAKICQMPTSLPFETVLSNQMFAVRLAMERLRAEGCRRIGLFVAEHDEVHNRNLYTSGFYVAQRQFAPEDRIPPFVGPEMSLADQRVALLQWAAEHRVDAVISNWNNVDEITREIPAITRHPCRFLPLDADDSTRPLGGIDQNHEEVGRRAVDLIVGQMQTFRRGIPKHASITLVDPEWIEPAKAFSSLRNGLETLATHA